MASELPESLRSFILSFHPSTAPRSKPSKDPFLDIAECLSLPLERFDQQVQCLPWLQNVIFAMHDRTGDRGEKTFDRIEAFRKDPTRYREGFINVSDSDSARTLQRRMPLLTRKRKLLLVRVEMDPCELEPTDVGR